MATSPRRETQRLHLGRISAAGAVYFVTFVTAGRTPWLRVPAAAQAVLAALREWHDEGDGAVLAATVMPDHVHVLFELGDRLDVGRCVSRWKTVSRRKSGYAGEWQRDFWERRLREDESLEDYGLYVLLNPYRAGLAVQNTPWPLGWIPENARFCIAEMLGPRGEPPVEWIGWPAERFSALKTGE